MLALVDSAVKGEMQRPIISTFLKLLRARTQDLLLQVEGFAPGSQVYPILSSDTICQLNQFNTNSEAAMLSIPELSEECIYKIIQEL